MSPAEQRHLTASAQPSAPAVTQPRYRRWLLGIIGLAVVLASAFYLGGGWYFSGELAQSTFDAAAHRAAATRHSYTILVISANSSAPGGSSITLNVPPGSPELVTEGTWGVLAPHGGFGQIGHILARTSETITREFRQLTGPAIYPGEKLELVNDSFPENPLTALGLPFEEVTYPGPLGAYPAWFIAGPAPDWAVMVHGDALHRQDEMEMLAPIHRAGLPMLVITYRNDPGAPPAPDGMVRYGQTEWQDLQAAVSYALANGARHVVLVGRSMGGGVVLSFLEHSSLAAQVKAVILDSPMLDFSQTVDYGASQRSLPVVGLPIPSSLVATAKWIAGLRYGVDFASLDYLAEDARLGAPILLFQGIADKTVPQATSDRLAKDRPDLVTYVLTPGAGHLDSWNLDPVRYEGYVEGFAAAHATD
jgi:alpha-beta hydrolase superfamily lysophospholipase